MENEADTIEDMKEDVDYYRGRVRQGWEQVRSAVDPRDRIEDTIRRYPLPAVGVAAVVGAVAGSAFLPRRKRSPLGAIMGGMFSMAYRGFFLAATPIFTQYLVETLSPQRTMARPSLPPRPRDEFPPDVDEQIKREEKLARRPMADKSPIG